MLVPSVNMDPQSPTLSERSSTEGDADDSLPIGQLPFLKWAGGKRWLVPEIKSRVPAFQGTYFEPFLGGAAVFFGLRPDRAVLADLNDDLVQLYETMRDAPTELHNAMCSHQLKHDKSYYYRTRASEPTDPIQRAARTLYLNRTCFNGLWRVNRRGEFNVPMGSKTSVVFPNESFSKISAALYNVQFHAQDFERTIDSAGENDFVYVDPPYTVAHNYNAFVKYNDRIFRWADQVRLRDAVKRAAHRGAGIIVSNANHDSIKRLYDKISVIEILSRYSVIAGPAERRAPTSELLISVGV